MTQHTPGGDWGASERRDDDLVRGLIAVVELMIATDDHAAVWEFVVAQCLLRLGIAGVTLMLGSPSTLAPVGAAGDGALVLGELQRVTGVGPSVEAVLSAAEVDAGIDEARERWPAWASAAAGHDVVRVTALPVRLVDTAVGALELHLEEHQTLTSADCQVARTFAGLAAVVMHHDEELRRSSTQVAQLEHALRSRVLIEQSKGFLLAHGCASAEEAFERMRSYARRTGRRIPVVADDVVHGRLDPRLLCG